MCNVFVDIFGVDVPTLLQNRAFLAVVKGDLIAALNWFSCHLVDEKQALDDLALDQSFFDNFGSVSGFNTSVQYVFRHYGYQWPHLAKAMTAAFRQKEISLVFFVNINPGIDAGAGDTFHKSVYEGKSSVGYAGGAGADNYPAFFEAITKVGGNLFKV
jgi:hypothetical protein